MGKRGRKRGQPRKKKQENSEFPSGFTRTVEQWERLAPVLHSGTDLANEIEKRRRELVDLLARFDAIHILGHVVMSEMLFDPDSYVESEHQGAAHLVELAAAVLLTRESRAGESDVTPAIDANTLGPARTLLGDIAFLEGFRRFRNAGALGDDPLASARGRAATKHLTMRAPGWPWQERAVLLDLFGSENIANRLRKRFGSDAADAAACVEAIPSLIPRRIAEHGQRAMEDGRDEALKWASVTLRGWQDSTESFRDRALTALWAMNHLGDAMLFTAEDVAAEAGVEPSIARAVVDLLSTPFGQGTELFATAERVRVRPYIEVGEGEFFCTVPGNDLWALRSALESGLKDGEQYARHRGRWLERRAGEMLAAALEPDEIHFSVGIVREGGEDLGEIDVLLRFDDTVIAVEAKGATMRPGARRGGQSLIDHLKENLTKAAKQGSLALRALTGGEPVALLGRDGEPLSFDRPIREVHPVVVTLEDLSAVAPVLWELAGTAVLPDDVTVPWVVTLYELEHVCATVAWPQQFVHFLRRRSELNDRADRLATDELDWWMLYLDTSLYFEGPPEPDALVRYLSLTDPLDAWMLYEHGERSVPAEKPRQDLDEDTVRFLDKLASERPPGWVAAGCSFLDVSGDSREQMHRHIREAKRRARQREKVQRGTLGFTEARDGLLLSWVVVPDEGARFVRPHLEEYVAERCAEFGMQRVLGVGLTASTRRPYDALLVQERERWQTPPGPAEGSRT